MIYNRHGTELRSIESRHLPQMRDWRNNPAIYSQCRQVGLISEASHLRWYDKMSQDDSIVMFSIYKDDEFRGVCGLTSIDRQNQRAEFSLYIGTEFQGHGLSYEALESLLSFGFSTLNLNLIWGETFDGNFALKIFKKMGMKEEGTRRQFYFKNGKFIDAHLVSITRDEWNKQCQT